ncbi:MAG: CvpA family protein [Chloroflexi bacterium]|nr:CvpA family protein [Chloroflexota bacterium]MCI0575396.1 CvpA family protein [Chloroflexota bacterium]MCI0645452.1 CvpA family protein [Chloroflexota bacterium]MCI0726719.1 CvpA family protein [Chloroflexota bacterium]
MVSLQILFWLMVLFFALIGYMRGWQKEVIAFSGLVASIAVLHWFGAFLVRVAGADLTPDPLVPIDLLAIRQRQFWVQAIFHTIIAFFSYQVVGRIAEQIASGRLGERLRAGLERRIVGLLIGAINGYLVIGGLWSFLEYQVTPAGYVQLPLNETYAFDPAIITRPLLDSSAMALTSYLPMGIFSPTVWLLIFFLTFFVVIIALI